MIGNGIFLFFTFHCIQQICIEFLCEGIVDTLEGKSQT